MHSEIMSLKGHSRIALYFLAALLSFSGRSLANDSSCGQLNSVQNVVRCALENAPAMVDAQTTANQAFELDSVARQRPNPEISGTSTFGSSLGDNIVNINADLTHTIEMGGKRSARIDKAAGDILSSKAILLRAKENTIIGTLQLLYRLRQLALEIRTIDEAIETFQKIQKQYRSRGRLGPEQEVSSGIFQLAEGDYQLRKNLLEIEKVARLKELSVAVGRPIDSTPSFLPEPKISWPSFQKMASGSDLKGSVIQMPKAELQMSQAELELARSESWPNVKVGPSYQAQTLGPYTQHTYGFNLSFAIPVFQANGGGRSFAHQGVTKAERNLSVAERQTLALRDTFLVQYERAVKVFKESVSIQEMEKKHRSVEVLFRRGVIPSSLVIEAHRQMVDFTKSKNEHELVALEAMWRLFAIEGRLIQEIL